MLYKDGTWGVGFTGKVYFVIDCGAWLCVILQDVVCFVWEGNQ